MTTAHTLPTPTPRPLQVARVVKSSTVGQAGMEEGRVWVEAYLPFDPGAYAEFTRKALALGGDAEAWRQAAAAEPALAAKALTPIDAHGEAMLAEDVQLLADRFLVESRKIDVMHDEQTRAGVSVVGSFVNTDEIASPHYYPGSWVVVLKVESWAPEFQAIKAGTLNAVSFQAVVSKVPIVVAPVPASSPET